MRRGIVNLYRPLFECYEAALLNREHGHMFDIVPHYQSGWSSWASQHGGSCLTLFKLWFVLTEVVPFFHISWLAVKCRNTKIGDPEVTQDISPCSALAWFLANTQYKNYRCAHGKMAPRYPWGGAQWSGNILLSCSTWWDFVLNSQRTPLACVLWGVLCRRIETIFLKQWANNVTAEAQFQCDRLFRW